METIDIKISGTRPLLMNSDLFADPLNDLSKEYKKLTSKRKKTDEDHEAIAKMSWLGSLYHDDNGPYLTGIMIEASIIAGGKLSKLGTALKRSMEVIDDRCHLEYKGPKTPDELWDAGFYDARSVKVGGSRVIRYRPIFRGWSVKFQIMFDPDAINREEIIKSATDAGLYCGVGDFRPKFGRYSVEVL